MGNLNRKDVYGENLPPETIREAIARLSDEEGLVKDALKLNRMRPEEREEIFRQYPTTRKVKDDLVPPYIPEGKS